jgi:hypothetical protein
MDTLHKIVIAGFFSVAFGSLSEAADLAPCAYLFKAPACLDGIFTLEVNVGEKQKILSTRVVASSTSAQSSGSIVPVAECVAGHMNFYAKFYIHNPDQLGKQTVPVNVVAPPSCKRP